MTNKQIEPFDSPAPSFLEEKPTKASATMWIGAITAFLALATLEISVAIGGGERSPAELFGRLLGVLLFPSLVVWLASLSKSASSQRAKVKLFFGMCVGLLLLALVTALSTAGYQALFHR